MAEVIGHLHRTTAIIAALVITISSQCQHVLCLGGSTQTDDRSLILFKESLKKTLIMMNWNIETDPCTWSRVSCEDGGGVIGLDLNDGGLSGDGEKMDVGALARLSTLRNLTMRNNNFSGTIPAFNLIGKSLRILDIAGNHFSGEIPDDFFHGLSNLEVLNLGSNNFSGRVPTSSTNLTRIKELRLDKNNFSGPVPLLAQPSLQKLDLSNNRLTGEIPGNLSRFGKNPFRGNPDLCGPVISVPCKEERKDRSGETLREFANELRTMNGRSDPNAKWVMLTLVSVRLFASWILKEPGEDHVEYTVLNNEIKSSTYWRSHSSNRDNNDNDYDYDYDHSYNEPRLPPEYGDRGNLVFVNEGNGVFHLVDLMKAAAEILGNYGLGSTYKSILASGTCVVVKRLRDMNRMCEKEFGKELMRFGMIRHRNVLPPLAYLYQTEEKLLVYEFIPGGNLYSALHGNHSILNTDPLNWPQRLKIIKGVARGLGFLHTEFSDYQLPHGNLKTTNILLSPNHEPFLTDYGLFQLIGNTHSVQRTLMAYKCPEVARYNVLHPKCDVYCLGLVVLEIVTGKNAYTCLSGDRSQQMGEEGDIMRWLMHEISSDRVVELIDPVIASSVESLDPIERMLYIAAACIEDDHNRRIEMREAIRRIDEIEVE